MAKVDFTSVVKQPDSLAAHDVGKRWRLVESSGTQNICRLQGGSENPEFFEARNRHRFREIAYVRATGYFAYDCSAHCSHVHGGAFRCAGNVGCNQQWVTCRDANSRYAEFDLVLTAHWKAHASCNPHSFPHDSLRASPRMGKHCYPTAHSDRNPGTSRT